MSNKPSRLGRGLDALIPTSMDEFITDDAPEIIKESGQRVIELGPETIVANPHQPRMDFEDAELQDLAESIKVHGIVQPLIVAQKGSNYQLIAGERRLRAAKLAGLKTVPVIVRSFSEQEELEVALIENVQRAELKPLEKATAYAKLVNEFNMTVYQISERVGKAQPTVSNTMRLLNLDRGVKKALSEGRLSEGQARAILGVGDDVVAQRQLLARIVRKNMTVREIEDLARTFRRNPGKQTEAVKQKRQQSSALTRELGKHLGTKVSITPTAKGGRLVIEYYSEEELERLYSQLLGKS